MNTEIQDVVPDRAYINEFRSISGDIQEYHGESSSIKLKLDDLNSDVLRHIFDHLNLTDILSVQRVCTRFEVEARYRRPSSKFELHSVVMRRSGKIINCFKETKLILRQYGKDITDLDANYSCFVKQHMCYPTSANLSAIINLSENVRAFCTQLKIYTVKGLMGNPNIRFSMLHRPNLKSLHTLRLCNFSKYAANTDLDVAACLFECTRTLRKLHIENMFLTGQCLVNAPDTLESLELIHLHNIDMGYVLQYVMRNPQLKRFELVTRYSIQIFRSTYIFYDQIAQVEHLKLQAEIHCALAFPFDVGPLRDFVNLKSLELNAFWVFNLPDLFAGLAMTPIMERLSITLTTPSDMVIYQSLKRLKKLQYFKVRIQTDAIASEIESLILSVSEAVGLTELGIESAYGCNLLPMFIHLPNLQKFKLKITGCYTNLKHMAYVSHLSDFEVRLSGDSAITEIGELLEKLEEQRKIKRLTVTLLSSTKFQPNILLEFEKLAEIGIKSFVTEDSLAMYPFSAGRTFEVRTDAFKNVRLITDLVKERYICKKYAIVIIGEVGSKYSEFGQKF